MPSARSGSPSARTTSIGSRTGSGLDEQSLVEIGEQPELRHYDLANRTRNRFVGQVDVVPSEALTLSLSTGLGGDDFDDSYFGLQEATFRNVSVSADYQLPRGLGVGGTYNYERYTGLQQSRSASPGEQAADPNRNWTADTRERVHYFSIYLQPPRFGPNTEARLSYDYAHARREFRLCGRTCAACAVAVAGDLQQAAGFPVRRAASPDRAAGGKLLVHLRAVDGSSTLLSIRA